MEKVSTSIGLGSAADLSVKISIENSRIQWPNLETSRRFRSVRMASSFPTTDRA